MLAGWRRLLALVHPDVRAHVLLPLDQSTEGHSKANQQERVFSMAC